MLCICGNDVTGKKFCGECGKKVEVQRLCTKCNVDVTGKKFCEECGEKVQSGCLSPRLKHVEEKDKVASGRSSPRLQQSSGITDDLKSIVQELNEVRSSPRAYAQKIKDIAERFDGLRLKRPGLPDVITTEGKSAALECISALESALPAPPLDISPLLNAAAMEHVREQGSHGETGHDGHDGSTTRSRIETYCDWQGHIGENINYGCSSAHDIVTSLLIDDNVPSRGHRLNILKQEFNVVGIAVGPHTKYRCMCVMDFATGVGPKVKKLDKATTVTTKGAISEQVEEILVSIPFDNIKQAVRAALTDGGLQEVTLVYTPSSIQATIKDPSGRTVTHSGSWGVQEAK